MKPWFSKLKWTSFRTLIQSDGIPFLELDKYADYTFTNGIEIRVCTGKMAIANTTHPYEMCINYPHGRVERIPYMNKTTVIKQMAKINRL